MWQGSGIKHLLVWFACTVLVVCVHFSGTGQCTDMTNREGTLVYYDSCKNNIIVLITEKQ